MKTTWNRVRPIVFAAWAVAALRLVFEFTMKPEVGDPAFHVSVNYLVAAALVIIGLAGRWGPIGFKSLLASTAMIAVLAFGAPNAISYTTGQFQGWTHGRFRPPEPGKTGWGEDPKARAAPLGETPVTRLGLGLAIGAGTMVSAFIGTTVVGLVFVYLPATLRRRRKRN